MSHIYIILVTYNRAQFLNRCLTSFHEATACDNYTLVVWDNNSTDDTRAVVTSFATQNPRIRPVHNHVNIYQSAFAESLRKVPLPPDTQYIVTLEDDVVHFSAGWLKRMVTACECVPFPGYFSANVVQDDITDGRKEPENSYIDTVYGEVPVQLGPVGGWCSITPVSTYTECGGFAQAHPAQFFTYDYEYQCAVASRGYIYGIVKDVLVYHATGEESNMSAGYGPLYREKYATNPRFEYRASDMPSVAETKKSVRLHIASLMKSLQLYTVNYYNYAEYVSALIRNGLDEEPMLLYPGLISKGMYVATTLQQQVSVLRGMKRSDQDVLLRLQSSGETLVAALKTLTNPELVSSLSELKDVVEQTLLPSLIPISEETCVSIH